MLQLVTFFDGLIVVVSIRHLFDSVVLRPYYFSRSICFSPHKRIWSITGISSTPVSVNEYSDRSGDSKYNFLVTNSSSSNSLRAWLSIFVDMPSTSLFNSPYRRTSSFRYHSILPLYFPPTRWKA